MNTLIVESSVQIIERLAEMLLETGNVKILHLADSYDEGVKLFNEKKPDIVLLDMRLPENNSVKLLKEVKEKKPDTTVIALTIYTDDNFQQECKSHGADHIFDKYLEFEKIPILIDQLKKQAKR